MLSEWFYAKELHEMFAIVFAGGFLGFFAVAFSILGIKEERLRQESIKLFQDEDEYDMTYRINSYYYEILPVYTRNKNHELCALCVTK